MAVSRIVSGAAGTFEVFSFFVKTLPEGGENISYSVSELEFQSKSQRDNSVIPEITDKRIIHTL